MKILVPVKRVLDYNLRPRVKSDGSGVDLESVKMSMNPFDERAVEAAVRLKEIDPGHEVVVVSIGPAKARETLLTALAMGADRAILIETEQAVEPLAVAKLLKAVAADEHPQLIVMGKLAIDDDSGQTGQMLAALMDRPQGTFVSHLEINGNTASVRREVDGGMEALKLTLPAIVTVDLRLNAPRTPALPQVMKAKLKAMLLRTPADYGVDITPRLEILSVVEPARRQSGVKVANVDELIAKLKLFGVSA